MRRSICSIALAALAALAGLAGCGGGSPSVDAPPRPDAVIADARPDAAPSTVMLVSCAAVTPAVTITTVGMSFSPADVTINAGDVLEFSPAGLHNMTSDEPGQFATPTSQHACLHFTAPGLFFFHCSVHPSTMMGSVTVN